MPFSNKTVTLYLKYLYISSVAYELSILYTSPSYVITYSTVFVASFIHIGNTPDANGSKVPP